MADTRLEDDLNDVLWNLVNIFHRKIANLDRALDDNEQAQRRSQREQDGSEAQSVELERLTAQGISIIERRNAFEDFREIGASWFEKYTFSARSAERRVGDGCVRTVRTWWSPVHLKKKKNN